MITVITTHGRFTVADAEHWARDDEDDVHLYDAPDRARSAQDDTDSLATIEGARFIACYKTETANGRLERGDGFDRNPNTPDR